MSERPVPLFDGADRQILAVLFAAGDPLELERLAAAIGMDTAALRQTLDRLRERLAAAGLPFELLELEDSVQLATAAPYAGLIRQVLAQKRSTPLSQSAMEVLAIVAYNQPVTKSFVEQVRGVDSSSIVNSLTEKELLQEAGRLDVPGRPILYETTPNFLRCFGLSSLEELPKLPDESGQLKMDDVMAAQEAEEASQQEE